VTVTDSEGNARTSSPQTVVIGTTLPTVNFDFSPKSNINAGDVVTFTNTSTPLSGPTFSWNFGDGTTSTEQSPRHAFFKSGNVTVTLTATTSGCSASKSQTVTVAAPKRPLVRAWPNPVTNSTRFGFSLPDRAKSSGIVRIFTMAGKSAGEVRLNSQSGEVSWNVPSDLPNGPYYYVLIAGGSASKVGKLVIHR
jgi:PKD repeat protein